jgi:hypothetical protein
MLGGLLVYMPQPRNVWFELLSFGMLMLPQNLYGFMNMHMYYKLESSEIDIKTLYK